MGGWSRWTAGALVLLAVMLAGAGCVEEVATGADGVGSDGTEVEAVQSDDEPGAPTDEPADPSADAGGDAAEATQAASTTVAPIPGAVAAEVERPIDGDSLEIRTADGVVEVRLIGINAPELNSLADRTSCPGAEARAVLGAFLASGPIEFVAIEEDRFGRTLGDLYVGGVSAAEVLVRAGWALALWSNDDPALIDAMILAMDERRGWWGDVCGSPTQIWVTDWNMNAPGDDRENLDQEWVEITNRGPEAVDLRGWAIRDETTSNRFLLDDVGDLDAGGTLRVITGRGSSGGGSFYLGEEFPVWSNRGETVLVQDPEGLVAGFAVDFG
ncbi:MAG: lamin tail domain-containing protein [Actinomycetota bacterium]